MSGELVIYNNISIPRSAVDHWSKDIIKIDSGYNTIRDISSGYHSIAKSLLKQMNQEGATVETATKEHFLESLPVEVLILMTDLAINTTLELSRKNLFTYISNSAPANFSFLGFHPNNSFSAKAIPIIDAIKNNDTELFGVLVAKYEDSSGLFRTYAGSNNDIPSVFSEVMINSNPEMMLALLKHLKKPSSTFRGHIGPVQCAYADEPELLENIAKNLQLIREHEQGSTQASQREKPEKTFFGNLLALGRSFGRGNNG